MIKEFFCLTNSASLCFALSFFCASFLIFFFRFCFVLFIRMFILPSFWVFHWKRVIAIERKGCCLSHSRSLALCLLQLLVMLSFALTDNCDSFLLILHTSMEMCSNKWQSLKFVEITGLKDCLSYKPPPPTPGDILILPGFKPRGLKISRVGKFFCMIDCHR